MNDLSALDVVILAGGMGKRLRSATGEAPKVLAQVNGIPFLDILLKNLADQGLRRMILCTGYKSEEIEQYYQTNRMGLEIVFSQETVALGTGGAIKNAGRYVHSPVFFALNGDCFCNVCFLDFLKFHREKNALASLVLSKLSDKKDFGSVTVDAQSSIVSFQEKNQAATSPYASVGMYCFDQEIFARMPSKQTFSIEQDFFPFLTGQRFYGYLTDKEFLDIGTPERYSQAQQRFKN